MCSKKPTNKRGDRCLSSFSSIAIQGLNPFNPAGFPAWEIKLKIWLTALVSICLDSSHFIFPICELNASSNLKRQG